jgi:hypothetical protein
MIEIDVTTVREVLLAGDNWHEPDAGSFTIDAVQFTRPAGGPQDGAGTVRNEPGPWFSFTEENVVVISGPLSSIVAVRQDR